MELSVRFLNIRNIPNTDAAGDVLIEIVQNNEIQLQNLCYIFFKKHIFSFIYIFNTFLRNNL